MAERRKRLKNTHRQCLGKSKICIFVFTNTEVTAYIFNIVSKVLGIINHSAKDWYINNLKIPVSEVEGLIAKRAEARKNKDFALADSVRAELTEKGVEIIDTPEGTRFRTLI